MPVSASAIGARLEPRRIQVTPQMIRSFATAIGYDPEAGPKPMVAPQPFCVSLEWRLMGAPEAWDRLQLTGAERFQAVHAGQDSRFHRLLHAGEDVTISAEIADICRTRAGALVTSVFTICGQGPDDPVTTSRITSLYRGVQTDAPQRSGAETPAPSTEMIRRRDLPIARDFPHRYSEGAGIWNPIHTEREVALRAGLPDIIVHGSALWALAWKHLERAHGPLARLAGRFSAMVVPGLPATLACSGPDPASGRIAFRLENHKGEAAISEGYAEFLSPAHSAGARRDPWN